MFNLFTGKSGDREESQDSVGSSPLKRVHADIVNVDTDDEDAPQKKGWFLF